MHLQLRFVAQYFVQIVYYIKRPIPDRNDFRKLPCVKVTFMDTFCDALPWIK